MNEHQVDQHVAGGLDLAGIARLAQDARGRKPRPSRNRGKSTSTSLTRSRCRDQPSRIVAGLDPHRDGVGLVEEGVEAVTAGSSAAVVVAESAARSPIDRLLEAIHADAAIGVDEAFAGLADRAVLLDRALDRVDDAVLVEAGAGDLGLRGLLVARAAEQELVILAALPVDAEDADVARVVVAAGVDAAARS